MNKNLSESHIIDVIDIGNILKEFLYKYSIRGSIPQMWWCSYNYFNKKFNSYTTLRVYILLYYRWYGYKPYNEPSQSTEILVQLF